MLEWSPMFIGHYAVGLIGKKFAPRTSLGALIAAPILLDLLWPSFIVLGWGHVSIGANTKPFLRVPLDSYPRSRGRSPARRPRGSRARARRTPRARRRARPRRARRTRRPASAWAARTTGACARSSRSRPRARSTRRRG